LSADKCFDIDLSDISFELKGWPQLDLSSSIRESDPDLSIDEYFDSDLGDASLELDMNM